MHTMHFGEKHLTVNIIVEENLQTEHVLHNVTHLSVCVCSADVCLH